MSDHKFESPIFNLLVHRPHVVILSEGAFFAVCGVLTHFFGFSIPEGCFFFAAALAGISGAFLFYAANKREKRNQ